MADPSDESLARLKVIEHRHRHASDPDTDSEPPPSSGPDFPAEEVTRADIKRLPFWMFLSIPAKQRATVAITFIVAGALLIALAILANTEMPPWVKALLPW